MKKIIVFIIFILTSVNCYASTDLEILNANKLKALHIYHGYPDGTLGLDKNITRAEISNLMIRILGYQNVALNGSEKVKLKDVEKSTWYEQGVKNIVVLNIMQGYPDKSFKPQENISFAECVCLMVRTTKNDIGLKGTWPNNYITKAKALGIIGSNNNTSPTKKLTRGEVATILYNTLNVPIK